MKRFMMLLALLVATPLWAQSGVFYDEQRDGEGIVVLRNEGKTLFYFYTYGGEQCELLGINQLIAVEVSATATATAVCPNSIFPPFKPVCDPVVVEVTETNTDSKNYVEYEEVCDLNGQRWFLGGGDWNETKNELSGFIYQTEGIDYPFGIQDPDNPFADKVGDGLPVGFFVLRPAGNGYQLLVVRFGNVLDVGDPLFNTVFNFTTKLFVPLVAEPK